MSIDLPRRVPSQLAVLAALFAVFSSAVAGAGVAGARALEDKEKTALAATVSEFDAAMRNDNFERVVATVPPKVMNTIAAKAGLEAGKIRAMMIEMMKSVLKEVKIESFSMDLPQAQYKELSSGTPYALIPTATVIAAGDKGRIQQTSHTLALIDEGKWYLVRVSDASQLMIVREVYPEFTGVEFPQGSMEVLKK